MMSQTNTTLSSAIYASGSDLFLEKDGVDVKLMNHSEGKCGYEALALMLGIDQERIFAYLNNL